MTDFAVTLAADRHAPWNGGEAPAERYATANEMLVAAGLAGWDVHFERLLTGSGAVYPNRRATVRGDTGEPLGIVGDRYVLISAEQAFAFGDAIVDSGQAAWERAGQYRNGETVFGCMELTHLDLDVPGDGPIKPYLLIVNSYGGYTPYQGILAYVRPVCVNTFQMARGTKTQYRFDIRHTGSLEGKVAMAREALGIAFRHAEDVRALTHTLALAKVVDDQVEQIMRATWPLPGDDPTEHIIERHHSTQAFANYLTSPTLDGIRGTAWGAFNAITEYVDHKVEYKAKGSGRTPDDVRREALITGSGEDRKERGLRAVLAAIR